MKLQTLRQRISELRALAEHSPVDQPADTLAELTQRLAQLEYDVYTVKLIYAQRIGTINANAVG